MQSSYCAEWMSKFELNVFDINVFVHELQSISKKSVQIELGN